VEIVCLTSGKLRFLRAVDLPAGYIKLVDKKLEHVKILKGNVLQCYYKQQVNFIHIKLIC
jgi:hypothetical protein